MISLIDFQICLYLGVRSAVDDILLLKELLLSDTDFLVKHTKKPENSMYFFHFLFNAVF